MHRLRNVVCFTLASLIGAFRSCMRHSYYLLAVQFVMVEQTLLPLYTGIFIAQKLLLTNLRS